MSTDYAGLSADDLAKQINDEYAVILSSEKANLPRALAIGEKLMHLKVRIPSDEWKDKLEGYCPNISYETATLYIRLFQNQEAWRAAAVAQNVEPTSLTIDAARRLLTKKRSAPAQTDDAETDDGAEDDGKPTAEAMEAKQARNAEAEAAELEDVDIDAERQGRVDRTFDVLMRTYPQDELLDLTSRLAKHLGMALVPEDKWSALEEMLTPSAQPTMQPLEPSVSSAASGFERRF
jgi:hypothetical protein